MTHRTFKAGDKVKWTHSQGQSTGRVVRKVTRPTDIRGHHVAASSTEPEYLVQSDKTGAKAVHRPDALQKDGR